MWIKKTKKDIAQIKIKKFRNYFILTMIILNFAYFEPFVTGRTKYHNFYRRLTVDDVVYWIPAVICISLLVGLIVAAFNFPLRNWVICEKCNKITKYNWRNKCKCGGVKIDMEFMIKSNNKQK